MKTYVVYIYEAEYYDWRTISTHNTLSEALKYINHLETIIHVYDMGNYVDVVTESNNDYRIETV